MKIKNSTSKALWVLAFLTPTLVIFILLYLTPLLTAIVSSFTRWNGFTSMEYVGFKNYLDILKDVRFHAALINTLKWAAYAAFVHVPFGVLVALILSRKPRGWRFVRATFMVPNIISRAALALLFLFVYKPESGILSAVIQKLGFEGSINWLYDPRTAFISVTNIWLWYAAVITLITMAELMSVNPQVYEAAKIDGASNFQIDIYINLPLIKRIIGTSIIIAVTSVFKMFDIIYMTTNGGPGNMTTNVAVMMINSIIHTNRYGYANTLGVILLILGMSVMLISTRVFKMSKAVDD